jgi:catechol-2,3-dioxygenase
VTITGVVELTLQVRDLQSLEAFYTDVFGLRVLKREDDVERGKRGRRALAAGPVAAR